MRRVILTLLCMLPMCAAESDERAQRIGAEVERRRILREQAAAEENARRVLREHESGAKKATDEQLAAARAVIRTADERKAKDGPSKKSEGVQVSLVDADMDTLAKTWRVLFGGTAVITDRAKSRGVAGKLSAPSLEELRKKMVSALRDSGIYVIERPDGVVFDTQPESK